MGYDQPIRHSSQPLSTIRSLRGILVTGMEGSCLQYPTGFACDVCDGIAVVDVNDGDHYLCAVHATEPTVKVDLTRDDPVVVVAADPAGAANVVMMGAPTPEPAAPITDGEIQKLLADVVIGLRGIQYRLQSMPPHAPPELLVANTKEPTTC